MDWAKIEDVRALINDIINAKAKQKRSGPLGLWGLVHAGEDLGIFAAQFAKNVCFEMMITGKWDVERARKHLLDIKEQEEKETWC